MCWAPLSHAAQTHGAAVHEIETQPAAGEVHYEDRTHAPVLLAGCVRPLLVPAAESGCSAHGRVDPMDWGLCFVTDRCLPAGLRREPGGLLAQLLLRLCQLQMQLQSGAAPLAAVVLWESAQHCRHCYT